MNLWETDAQKTLREEARTWLAQNVPDKPLPSFDTPEGFDAHRTWERKLYEGGWSVVSWPVEYGGRGRSIQDWLVFEEEYWRSGAPGRVNQNGLFLLGPTIQSFGTEAQKKRFLPAMAAGEEIWAQAWSEPGAGSDMAAIRCRATRVGDEYVISGQKTWSSRAAFADSCFGLFRTDSQEKRHKGLSYILVPLNSDGVTIRPIPQLDGKPGFAEIFFDNVRVPASNRIGEEGAGWQIAMETAGFERGVLLRSPARFQKSASDLIDLFSRNRHRSAESQRDVVSCWMDAEAYTLSAYEMASQISAGKSIGSEASGNKIFWSQMDKKIQETALEIIGSPVAAGAVCSFEETKKWQSDFLFSLAGSIYAGTNEIQKTIIAKRVLGLSG